MLWLILYVENVSFVLHTAVLGSVQLLLHLHMSLCMTEEAVVTFREPSHILFVDLKSQMWPKVTARV